jgi:hypothetical protein
MPGMRRTLPTMEIAAAALIAAYFLYFTIGSLRTEFTHDDLMNVYRGWAYPLPSLLSDNVLFFRFTPMYRPFGSLVYRAFFWPFGFDLFPIRVFLLMALAGNVFLTYKLCRLLTGSTEAALFAALVGSYHMKFGQLYYNTGMLYDILCFSLYFSGLVFYISIRRQGKDLKPLQGALLCALYILALDSKEVAVSFPAALFLYELLWHPPAFQAKALRRWLTRQMLAVWITAAITIAYVLGRVLFQEQGISNIGGYRITVSAGEYFAKLAYYLNEVFYVKDWLGPGGAAIFALVLLAAGALSRCRSLLFSALLFLGGILPVAFIHARALSAVYLPLAGLAICSAVLLEFVCSGLRRLGQQLVWQRLAFWLMFAAVGLFLVRFHPHSDYVYHALEQGEYAQIRDAREGLMQLHPEFPSGSRILIAGTPFPQYSPGYNNMFLIRLAYRDKSLQVEELARFEKNGQAPNLADFDYVLSYEDGRWIDVDPATLAFGSPQ